MTASSLSIPYAPAGPVLAVIRRARAQGVPEQFSTKVLRTRLGAAEGNADRVFNALTFLGLIDDDGRRTKTFERLGRTMDSEYERFLGEIVHRAYAPIFATVDPAHSTSLAVADAFRPYQPPGQRQRMMSLFLALCREARIVEIGALRSRHHAPLTKDAPTTTAENARLQMKRAEGVRTDRDTDLLYALIQRLPDTRRWSQRERQKWLQAVAATVDLVVDSEGSS
jgi:hypothetical protein